MIMHTLTKAEMAERLISELNFTRQQAKQLVEDFFEEVKQILANDTPVKLSGFGNFELRNKSERPGRNPRTGEEVPITARRVVTFHPGQKLRAKVENNIESLAKQLKK